MILMMKKLDLLWKDLDNKKNMNYFDTYLFISRMLIIIAIINKLKIYWIDVKMVYGDLNKEIYIK